VTAVGQRLKLSTLVKNALSLMFSTVGSAALGFAFWVTAAHLFSQRDVGRASAEIAAITMASSLGLISVVWVLARFLPVARARTGMILRRGYGAALTITWTLACGFVVLGFGDKFLGHSTLARLSFVLTVLLFAIFSLQDVALTALRRAPWVLAENLAVGAARLVLLLAAVFISRRIDVISAWAIPMLFSVGLVNWLIFRRLAPAKEKLGDDRGLLPTRAQLMSYGSAQIISGGVGNIANTLPPLLVAAKLGPSASAVFYFPWLFITAVMALVWNILFSLIVEAVHDTDRTAHLFKRAAVMGGVVTCGSGLILGFGAHLILGVVGSEYRDSGVIVLQLFALSLPFIGVSSLYGALSLIERQTWTMTYLEVSGTVVFIVGGVLLMPRFGAAALGLTFLIEHVIIAMITVPGIARRYQRLAVADPTVVLRLDREAEAMAAETQILYPLFVALNPSWHADAPTVVQSSAALAELDPDAPTEPLPARPDPDEADQSTVSENLVEPVGVSAADAETVTSLTPPQSRDRLATAEPSTAVLAAVPAAEEPATADVTPLETATIAAPSNGES
jgi:O-antigen/teichoic acid export membrane protein